MSIDGVKEKYRKRRLKKKRREKKRIKKKNEKRKKKKGGNFIKKREMKQTWGNMWRERNLEKGIEWRGKRKKEEIEEKEEIKYEEEWMNY